MADLPPEKSLYIESEEEDENEKNEEKRKVDGHESDGSDSSLSSVGSAHRDIPSSYDVSWPQTYRRSIDAYTSVTPPTMGFLHGTPSLSRLSNSFLTTSFRGKHTPDAISSFIKPLLPSTTISRDQQITKDSYSHLLPSRNEDHDKTSRSTQKQCSYGQAVLNGINALCGVGILSTPNAIKQGGWLSLLVLLLFAMLSFYTGILLRRCLDTEHDLETYPDIGQAAFGTTGRVVISIVLYVELYACCVEYIILESDTLSLLFPNAQLNIGGMYVNSQVLFAVLTSLIVLPSTWLRDLSLLSYISAGGVIASLLVVVSLCWVGLSDQVSFKNEGHMVNLSGLPIAIGLYGYCYSGHAVFPNIYSSLKNPNEYSSFLFTSFFICTILYGGVAILGYAMFGESTLSQFTLNMPTDLAASKVAVWTTVVNPIAKYSLTLMPMALSLEELIPNNHQKSRTYSIMIRTALVFSVLFVALSVPFFGLVMALVGSFLTMLVTLIFPCICFIRILRDKVTLLEVSMCSLIIAVGVICAVVGSFSALAKIIQSLN